MKTNKSFFSKKLCFLMCYYLFFYLVVLVSYYFNTVLKLKFYKKLSRPHRLKLSASKCLSDINSLQTKKFKTPIKDIKLTKTLLFSS